MVKRRKTPETDVERLAERIYNFYGDTITDKDSFDNAFDEYISELTQGQDKKLRKDVYKEYKKNYIKVRERPRRKIKVKPKIKRELTVLGKVKRTIVYAEPTSVVIKGREVRKFRDRYGRFVKVKQEVKDKYYIYVKKEKKRKKEKEK